MKIALVAGGLPFGGTTTFCMFLGRGLQSLGVPVEIFSFSWEHPLKADFEQMRIPVQRENERHLIFEDRLAGVYQSVKAYSPTVVFQVIGVEGLELFRYLPGSVLRVAMVHDHYQPIYEQLPIYSPVYDHVVAVAGNIRTHIEQNYPAKPCTYVQHGVFLNPPERMRAPNPSAPLKIIFFGRLDHASKRVRIFPRIWQALKQAGVPFQWTIHGTGPDEAWLHEQLAEAVRLGDVTFSKPVPHDQLGDIIRRHDVYLLTSQHEAGPLTLLEAMGFGLVPVCADIPCLLQEVINPRNGYRVGPEDIDAYVRAFAGLHCDRTLLETLSKAARQTVETGFSEVAMAKRYVEFVERTPAPRLHEPWPEKIDVRPMMYGRNAFSSLPLRPVRRLLKRMNRFPAAAKIL